MYFPFHMVSVPKLSSRQVTKALSWVHYQGP